MTAYEKIQDLRDLEPPEPLLIILETLDSSPKEITQWSFLLPGFPNPLLPHLSERNLTWRSEPSPDWIGICLYIQKEIQ